MSELIPIDRIFPNPFQPRRDEDPAAVAELAESIQRNGLMQIPTARRVDGHYELAFGHTRLAAFVRLDGQGVDGYRTMPLNIAELTDLQMFELGVAENIKRKDLSPVEQAMAMKRYMDEFGKNSAETGEFFGVNDATVRGKIRLLDLPAEAQEKLAIGVITEGTARTLLSMQKVTGKKEVLSTINRIEKHADDELPEVIIERAMDNLHDVVEMWNTNNKDGKARSSREAGWLLDMKNFPNKYLPVLTPMDIAMALGIQDDQETLEKIGIEYQDLDDTAFSESLRKRFAGQPDQLTKIEHLLNPPTCTACPFYTKVRGNHYCGLKMCHQRKTDAWHKELMLNASKNLKIAVYDPAADGKSYAVLESWEHKKLFENRVPGLRLMLRKDIHVNGYLSQFGYKGIEDDAFMVIATGEALDKLRSASGGRSKGGKKTEKEKAEMRAMKVYRMRRKELLWEYTATAQGLFENVPLEVLRKICGWHFIGIDDRIPEEYDHPQTGNTTEKSEFQRRALVWRLIVGETSHYTRSELVGLLKKFEMITSVKAPKSLVKRVQEWDAEINGLARVSAETKGKKKEA